MGLRTRPINRQILYLLTWQLRVVTATQLRRILVARFNSSASATRTVRPLIGAGLIMSARTVATFVESAGPLCVWNPGRRTPNVAALAWQLEKRWAQARARTVTICWATQRAARLMGGLSPFRSHASQLEHDLGTAGILTALYETAPNSAANWVSEDILHRDFADDQPAFKKLPDGVLVNDGLITQVLEFGGQYSQKRLRRFHRHFARHRIPYAIY